MNKQDHLEKADKFLQDTICGTYPDNKSISPKDMGNALTALTSILMVMRHTMAREISDYLEMANPFLTTALEEAKAVSGGDPAIEANAIAVNLQATLVTIFNLGQMVGAGGGAEQLPYKELIALSERLKTYKKGGQHEQEETIAHLREKVAKAFGPRSKKSKPAGGADAKGKQAGGDA